MRGVPSSLGYNPHLEAEADPWPVPRSGSATLPLHPTLAKEVNLIDHDGCYHPSFAITSPNSTSSLGKSFGVTKGLDTQVSLIRSRQVMLLLVPFPPHEPQPSEKVWRIPFHKLPLFDAACG